MCYSNIHTYINFIKVHLTPILFLLLNNFRHLCSTVVKKILKLLKSTSFRNFQSLKNCAKIAAILVQVRVIGRLGLVYAMA